MLTRRHFLDGISATMAAAAVTSAIPSIASASAGKTVATKGDNVAAGHYRLDKALGLGGAPLGNNFKEATDEDALATLEAAWKSGIRYYDTSPWYGLGISERRFGFFLHNKKPEDYILSTKVGRLLKPGEPHNRANWKGALTSDYAYDYTATGTRRSIEDSLQRLGVNEIDIVFIHDLSPDNKDMDDWTEYFDIAAKGAMPELARMKKEGIIKAWGFGVNRPEPALKALEAGDPDIFLLATQYSLLEHQDALYKTFPALDKRGVSVVVGAPLNAGYLAGTNNFNYSGTIPPGIAQKRERLAAIASSHGVDLRTAAIRFALAPKTVSAVLTGARNATQIEENAVSLKAKIPAAFWQELKAEELIAPQAPVPA